MSNRKEKEKEKKEDEDEAILWLPFLMGTGIIEEDAARDVS